MLARCELKKLVLESVSKREATNSSQIAMELRPYGVSKEDVSMTLLKCKRQGLVDRSEYKVGRVRGFMYRMLRRGEERLLYYYRREKKGATVGAVDIKGLVRAARREMTPLDIIAIANTNDGNHRLQEYLDLSKHEFLTAFASEKFLRACLPEVSRAIREASKEMTIWDVIQSNISHDSSATHTSSDTLRAIICYLQNRRIDELHAGQFLLYMGWQEEKRRGDSLQRQLEEERRLREFSEKEQTHQKFDSVLMKALIHVHHSGFQALLASQLALSNLVNAHNSAYYAHPTEITYTSTSRENRGLPTKTTNPNVTTKQEAEPFTNKTDKDERSTVAANVLPIIAISFGVASLLFASLGYLYGPDIKTVLHEFNKIVRDFANYV